MLTQFWERSRRLPRFLLIFYRHNGMRRRGKGTKGAKLMLQLTKPTTDPPFADREDSRPLTLALSEPSSSSVVARPRSASHHRAIRTAAARPLHRAAVRRHSSLPARRGTVRGLGKRAPGCAFVEALRSSPAHPAVSDRPPCVRSCSKGRSSSRQHRLTRRSKRSPANCTTAMRGAHPLPGHPRPAAKRPPSTRMRRHNGIRAAVGEALAQSGVTVFAGVRSRADAPPNSHCARSPARCGSSWRLGIRAFL